MLGIFDALHAVRSLEKMVALYRHDQATLIILKHCFDPIELNRLLHISSNPYLYLHRIQWLLLPMHGLNNKHIHAGPHKERYDNRALLDMEQCETACSNESRAVQVRACHFDAENSRSIILLCWVNK